MPAEIRTIQQAYRFALDPTPRQERMLRSHARFQANRASEQWRRRHSSCSGAG
jgi:hypothetical protein